MVSRTFGFWKHYKSHFKTNPSRDAPVYLTFTLIFLTYVLVVLFEPLLRPRCGEGGEGKTDVKWPNPKYDDTHCLDRRYYELLMLTARECDFVRRILASIIAGSIIGYERRSPDRPAGIRTMSVVALSSCTFTLSSMFAFEDGTMAWDASRVTAAIPSGVGFLGSGLIWKGIVGNGADQAHHVHGLTTAATIWLSAAVGTLCGGAMYVIALFTVMTTVMILRFGPRSDDKTDDDDDEEDEEQEVKDQPSIYRAPSMPPLVREPSLLMSRQTSTTLGLSPPGGRGEQEEPLLNSRESNQALEHQSRPSSEDLATTITMTQEPSLIASPHAAAIPPLSRRPRRSKSKINANIISSAH